MTWVRRQRRNVGWLAALLLALQPLLMIAGAATAAPVKTVKKLTEITVICSVHGTMTVEVEQDVPGPVQPAPNCSCCLHGCPAGAAAAVPLPALIGTMWLPAPREERFAAPRDDDPVTRLLLPSSTSPRGPPAVLA